MEHDDLPVISLLQQFLSEVLWKRFTEVQNDSFREPTEIRRDADLQSADVRTALGGGHAEMSPGLEAEDPTLATSGIDVQVRALMSKLCNIFPYLRESVWASLTDLEDGPKGEGVNVKIEDGSSHRGTALGGEVGA